MSSLGKSERPPNSERGAIIITVIIIVHLYAPDGVDRGEAAMQCRGSACPPHTATIYTHVDMTENDRPSRRSAARLAAGWLVGRPWHRLSFRNTAGAGGVYGRCGGSVQAVAVEWAVNGTDIIIISTAPKQLVIRKSRPQLCHCRSGLTSPPVAYLRAQFVVQVEQSVGCVCVCLFVCLCVCLDYNSRTK